MNTPRPSTDVPNEQVITDQSPQRIVIDDTELEYEECGSGEPVLLIHGGILADAFAPLLAEPTLTDQYRVISYHRRGFAGSARAAGEVSIARQAADAHALLGHLGISQAHVVGHSYGALIALQLALDTPDAVHSLALLEPPLLAVPSGERFVATVFAPAIERYGAGDRVGAVDTVLRGVAGAQGIAALERTVPGALELAATDADTFFRTELPALQAWRFGADEARQIAQPALAMRGADSDAVAPTFREGVALLREWLPQTHVAVVADATHGMPFMNPRELALGLTTFFTRHPIELQTRQREDVVANWGRVTDRRAVLRSLAGVGTGAVLLPGREAESAAQEATPVTNPTAATPVKLVALYGSPTDAKAFERYYAKTHIPLAQQLPGLQRVETALLGGIAADGAVPYYRIAELWFAAMKQFRTAVASPQGQALAADVANFATGGVTVLVAQIDEHDVATYFSMAAD
jgi:uncharacterized protein (TIGR02118 family)